MELTIEGRAVVPGLDQSLKRLIDENNLDSMSLRTRPLAAKISGEVFTLNYVPFRSKDAMQENPALRRAMIASNGRIRLLRYSDQAGKEAYLRTMLFVLFLAVREEWPGASAKISCTLGNSVYISVSDKSFSVEKLRARMTSLILEDFPFVRSRMPLSKAIELFQNENQLDKASLLSWRSAPYFDVYSRNGFADYYYGEMLPSSRYLTVWDLIPAEGGVILVYPDDSNPDTISDFREMPHFFEVFSEGERWCSLMECESAAELNELTQSGRIRELIRINEALHEKRFSQIADEICQRGAKMIMLAGPSSSGKTTSANRLATQLRVHGKKPILISLDNYYFDRDKMKPGDDGKIDFEHIDTIDTALFRKQALRLLDGEEEELPVFNFLTGKREWSGKKLKLREDSVIIVEGLHALNPVMIPNGVDSSKIFRLYVSPLLPLNLDNHNRIPTSYLRLLRRIVRDYETRGASVQATLAMWESVQRGERRWIYPFQERADVIFNSSTLYELAVLKRHIFPLLDAVQPEDECYDEVRGIVKILNYILEADVDDEIPPTSLVREFIGGNSFYK